MSDAAFRKHMIAFAKVTLTILREQPQGLTSSDYRDMRGAIDGMVKSDHAATLDEQDAADVEDAPQASIDEDATANNGKPRPRAVTAA